jgi:cytochrome oxidase Cu insertion factor (SCO1/SenC/PrrC family)
MGAGVHPQPKLRGVGAAQLVGIVILAILVAAIAAIGSHLLSTKSAPARVAAVHPANGLRGQATWAAGVRPAPAITTLRDQTGARFSLGSLHGHTVAMEFFDSHCKQECPLAGRALAATERALPRAQRPVLVVVSVNPLDTPASTRTAIRSWGLDGVAPWHWLRGTHSQLARAWKAYHIYVQPTKGDISHTEALYLIDRRGDERSGYLYPYLPAAVGHDLRVLSGPAGGPAGAHA